MRYADPYRSTMRTVAALLALGLVLPGPAAALRDLNVQESKLKRTGLEEALGKTLSPVLSAPGPWVPRPKWIAASPAGMEEKRGISLRGRFDRILKMVEWYRQPPPGADAPWRKSRDMAECLDGIEGFVRRQRNVLGRDLGAYLSYLRERDVLSMLEKAEAGSPSDDRKAALALWKNVRAAASRAHNCAIGIVERYQS